MAEILQYPHEKLSTPSPFFDLQNKDEIAQLRAELLSAYIQLPGNKAGLAAPQLGINKHMAIVQGVTMMNLEFDPVEQVSFFKEGCFSVDNAKTFHNVMRPAYGWAKWVCPFTFEAKSEKLTGMKARIFQHELDHLNGKLCNSATTEETHTHLK